MSLAAVNLKIKSKSYSSISSSKDKIFTGKSNKLLSVILQSVICKQTFCCVKSNPNVIVGAADFGDLPQNVNFNSRA